MHAASEDLSSALRQRAARRSTWVSVGVNTVLSALQLVVGLAAHSQALVADAVHSLSDLVSDFVVLLANRHSHQAADDGHPYGHQRFETGANLVLGLLLLGVGLGMEWAALDKLQSPQAPSALGGAALWVAFGALVCKEALFHYLLRVAKEVKSSMLVANAWHARSDAASSLVVLAGLVGSLAGYPLLDPIAAMVVGLLIVKMGWHFAWNALGDLMDRGADRLEVQAIDATLRATPGVLGVHALRTRKMGDMIVADVHIDVNAQLSVEQGHNIALAARDAVLRRHRVLSLMTHVDPAPQNARVSNPTTPATDHHEN